MLLRCLTASASASRRARVLSPSLRLGSTSTLASSGAPYRTSDELRASFLDFFAQKGHARVPSSNLVPDNDATLLFTNSGMVQFKEYFLNVKTPPFACATSAQKCLRVGGKHNDLDNVGHTARHQTFFEMLGNFSFGAYGKAEAIAFAWEYLTQVVKLPQERLSVSVLEGDEATATLWRNQIGLPASRIRSLGKSDNFWSMGAEGPCGPCTEIFWDQGHEVDGDRYLEIWNLVFMELEQRKVHATNSTETVALPRLCVDTGMGLERLASVVQGVPTNFHIDSLAPARAHLNNLFATQRNVTQDGARDEVATRVIVDHVRAAAFLLAEGVMPGSVGRAHVLRRLIRRASVHAWQSGLRERLFGQVLTCLLTPALVQAYPVLAQRRVHVAAVLEGEERAFLSVFERALLRFEEALRGLDPKTQTLSGDAAFALYASFGLPLDVTVHMASARGVKVNEERYETLKTLQATKSSSAWTGSGDAQRLPKQVLSWSDHGLRTRFTGYESVHEDNATLLGVHVDDNNSDEAWIALDPCPFYAEGGGQVGDVGLVRLLAPGSPPVEVRVLDTQRAFEGAHVLRVHVDNAYVRNALRVGVHVEAVVDAAHRAGVQRAHTCTHLLHAALRAVLGPHVVQSGSRVDSDTLRFDFAHPTALSVSELDLVEDHVNRAIAASAPMSAKELPYEEALTSGALALFSERYPPRVRVVHFGTHSKEICGGTHAHSTCDLLAMKLSSEASVSLGKRRIEALVGPRAVTALVESTRTLRSVSAQVHATASSLPMRLEALLKERAQLRAIANQSDVRNQSEQAQRAATLVFDAHVDNNAVRVHPLSESVTSAAELKKRALAVRDAEPQAVHVLLGSEGLVAISGNASDALHVGNLVRSLLVRVGGKGGGGKLMAEARLTSAELRALLTFLTQTKL